MFRAMIRRNPIVNAEFNHQRFVIARSRSGWLAIAMAVMFVVPSLILSIGYSILMLMEPATITDRFAENFNLPIVVLVFNLSLYPVLTMVSLGLSANSILRERQGKTWETLMLTNVGARQIILGKWLASLRAIAGDHIMVTIARLGLVVVLMGLYIPLFLRAIQFPALESASHFPIMAVIAVAYCVLDAALTSAIGILSAVGRGAFAAVIAPVALGLRIVLMLAGLFHLIITLLALSVHGLDEALILALGGLGLFPLLIALVLLAAIRLMD